MFAYVYSWLYPEPIETNLKDLNVINSNRIELITEKELLSVNLKPYNVIPSPARNMPNIDKFTLQVLSKAQLKDVLAVKLKKETPLQYISMQIICVEWLTPNIKLGISKS